MFLNTAPLAHLLSPERTRRSGLSDSGRDGVKHSSSKGEGCDLQGHESREAEKKKERGRKAWNSETRLLHLGNNIVWETASQERSRNTGSAQTGNISVEYTYFQTSWWKNETLEESIFWNLYYFNLEVGFLNVVHNTFLMAGCFCMTYPCSIWSTTELPLPWKLLMFL